MKTTIVSFLMAVSLSANAFSASHVVVHNPTRNSASSSNDSYTNGIQKLSDTTYVVQIIDTDSLVVFKTPQEAIVFRNKDQATYNEEHKNDRAWFAGGFALICLLTLALIGSMNKSRLHP